tara:strand:+ start:191 stop:922 length:732 start_codon:yes stop_codon:yes gene_type:complete
MSVSEQYNTFDEGDWTPDSPANPNIPFNPTNPNPYTYNWGGSNINQYIQGGAPVIDYSNQNQIQFLKDQGIDVKDLDESSLAYLPSMDRLTTAFNRMNTGIGMARTGLGFDLNAQRLAGSQNLLGMAGGQGLSSIGGSGFGRSGANMYSNIGNVNQAYQTGLNQSMAGFQSDVLNAQYDYQDTQANYLDALTTALGNLAASGEDQFTVNYTGNTTGTFDPSQFVEEGYAGDYTSGFDPNDPYD